MRSLVLISAILGVSAWRSPCVPRRGASTRLEAQKPQIPPEIIEAEEKAAGPGRNIRVAAFGALTLLSAGVGAVGTSQTPLAEAVPLHGNIIGNLLYAGVAGLSGTLVFLEFGTKAENQRRIYEEALKRVEKREQPTPAKRKAKGQASKRKKGASSKGFAAGASAPPPKQEQVQAAQAEALPTAEAEAELQAPQGQYESPTKPLGDAMEKVGLGQLFKEADSMAQASALKLNQELEDRGVLPRLDSEASPADSGSDSGGSDSDSGGE